MEDRPGCASGFTVTVKLCVALKLGDPLSATFKVKAFVMPACVTSGRHENAPLLVFKAALPGPVSKLKVKVCGGWSVSVTLAVKATVCPTLTVRLLMAANTGAVLVSNGIAKTVML